MCIFVLEIFIQNKVQAGGEWAALRCSTGVSLLVPVNILHTHRELPDSPNSRVNIIKPARQRIKVPFKHSIDIKIAPQMCRRAAGKYFPGL
jgi:hypothetical protein